MFELSMTYDAKVSIHALVRVRQFNLVLTAEDSKVSIHALVRVRQM